MTTFRFRPAPLRPELSFTLKDGLLSGSGWDLSLLDLTDLRFTGYKAAGRLIWRLDLIEARVTRRINVSLPAADTRAHPDFAAFHALSVALNNGLNQHNPDLQLTLGETGVTRHVMFGLGLLSGLTGLGISIGAIANGRIVAAAIPALLLLLIGAGLLRSYWPWTTPRRVAPATLPDLLTDLALDT